MAEQVVVDRRAASWLAAHALNELYYADQVEGCCAACCGPCLALARLLGADQLDDLVRSRAFGSAWWRTEQDRVDRDFLARAWRRTDCHPIAEGTTDADR